MMRGRTAKPACRFCSSSAASAIGKLADVAQSLDSLRQPDEGAELQPARDHPLDLVADAVAGEEIVPVVLFELLQPQRELLGGGVELEDDRPDRLAGLELGGEILDVPVPGGVAAVHPAEDAGGRFHHQAVVADAADRSPG